MARVLLAGGGTAGHVEPALNLADVIRERDPGASITFVGTERGLESRLVPERGYELELIPAIPMPRRLNRDVVALPPRLRQGMKNVRGVIHRRRIDVVVGFGGYVSMPAYFAARGRCPLVIHEANAKAGLANRVGAMFTSYVAQAVDGSLPNAVTLGIPLRQAIVSLDRAAKRDEARAEFGLDPDRPCLFVFGGSQGARRINEAVIAAAPGIIGAGMQILHAIGPSNADQVGNDVTTRLGPRYRALSYVGRMDLAYSAADLAMCRAGAMTCAELAAVGLPAIYVPLPIGNGEQRLNALPTVAAGGGEIMADSEMSAAHVEQAVIRLLLDPHALKRMSDAAASQGVRDAGERLADMVDAAIAAAQTKKQGRSA